MTDPFVELHRDEIERKAYCLHKQRLEYKQEDDAQSNFLRAIAIIKENYGVAERDNRL